MNARVALITGAGSGIGRAVAIELGRLGLHTILVGRRESQLFATSSLLNGGGFVAACDLSDRDEVRLLGSYLRERMGLEREGLGVLVHCAAAFSGAGFGTIDETEFADVFRANVSAPFWLVREMLEPLKVARGDVVMVNSSAVRSTMPTSSAYVASKAALEALTDNLRVELNPHGVRVMSVFPGRTATPMQAEVLAREGREYKPETLLQPEAVAQMVAMAIQLPRTAEVTEFHIRPARKAS